MTASEKVLWRALRNRRLSGAKFRRQQPFGPYVLDFYCSDRKLNVEVDGDSHDFPDGRAHDVRRTAFLKSEGVTTVRFWNRQVRENLEWVMGRIREELTAGSPSPRPSPLQGEGAGRSESSPYPWEKKA